MTFEQLATDFEKNPKKLCGVTINPKSTAVSSTATVCPFPSSVLGEKNTPG